MIYLAFAGIVETCDVYEIAKQPNDTCGCGADAKFH